MQAGEKVKAMLQSLWEGLNPKNLSPELPLRSFTVGELEKLIAEGFFRGKLCYGISEKLGDYYVVNPEIVAGLACIGTSGSGKSTSGATTAMLADITNGDRTFFIGIDPKKGLGDLSPLFKKNNFAAAVSTTNDDEEGGESALGVSKFITGLDYAYEEMNFRELAFSAAGGCKNLEEFEKKVVEYEKGGAIREKWLAKREKLIEDRKKKLEATPGLVLAEIPEHPMWYNPKAKKMSRICIIIEEFSFISRNKKVLNFERNLDKEGTAAWQMGNIMRAGRSYGIYFILLTQKLGFEDVPPDLKIGLNVIQAFRVASSGDAQIANAPLANDILPQQRGRCATSEGLFQIPLINPSTYEALYEKFGKEFDAHLFTFTPDGIRDAFKHGGVEAITMKKPLTVVYESLCQPFGSSFDRTTFIKKFLGNFGFITEKVNNPALFLDSIATRDGKRYAVVVEDNERKITKEIAAQINSVKKKPEINCHNVIFISLKDNGYGGSESMFKEKGDIALSSQKMLVYCSTLENKDKFEAETYKERFDAIELSPNFNSEDVNASIDKTNDQVAAPFEDEDDDEEIVNLYNKAFSEQPKPTNAEKTDSGHEVEVISLGEIVPKLKKKKPSDS